MCYKQANRAKENRKANIKQSVAAKAREICLQDRQQKAGGESASNIQINEKTV